MEDVDIRLLHGLCLSAMGLISFSAGFLIIRQLMLSYLNTLQKTLNIAGDVCEDRVSTCTSVTVPFISTVQAVMASVCGFVIINSCSDDIMTSRHWITQRYAWFSFPYFYYDAVAMYQAYYHSNAHIHKYTREQRFKSFMTEKKLMMVHHLLLPLVFFPIVLYLRGGRGEFFVGVFYMIELAVPFISFRQILVVLKMKSRPIYIVAGIAMIMSFFISRVLVFPFLFWKYATYKGIPLWSVPHNIPIKCNVGCLVILLPQIYWLCIMIRGAVRVIYKIH